MKKQDKELFNSLGGVDSYDAMFSDNLGGKSFQLGRGANNPAYVGQFDLKLRTRYFEEDTGTNVFSAVTVANVPASAQVQLPFFVFGHNDFQSGFPKLQAQYPISGSAFSPTRPFIYGKDEPPLAIDATVEAQLQKGDLVQIYTSTITGPTGGANDMRAVQILRANSVAYGSLLAALSSDTFVINGIRYTLADATKVAQYSNDISIFDISIFGKTEVDTLSPASFRQPEQFQDGIVDIPLDLGVDKHNAIAFYNDYDNIDQTLSVFVIGISKVNAA